MKSTIFTAPLLAIAAAVAMPAVAAPVFQVTPSVMGGPASAFNADKIDGGASALLTLDAVNKTVTGSGYVQFLAFSLSNSGLFGFVTGLNSSPGYEMWTTFNYTTKLVSGTFGAAGSLYDVTSLTFDVYARTIGGTANTYVGASVGPATAPLVTPGSGTAQLLGTGTLAAGPDSASFNTAGGTSFNANSVFTLSTFGKSFFTQPDPFYTNAFNSFTNTSSGFVVSGQNIALTQAVGSIDFANVVPEPSSLALVGLGLLAAGAAARRRNNS